MNEARASKLWSVVRVSGGNFLEMYDFMVFGYYASAVGAAFFPSGAMVVFLTEIMPVDFRTAGFSLAYSLAAGVFGGFTPAVSTYLIQVTGNRAIPGVWLSFAAACGLAAAILARPQSEEAPSYVISTAEAPPATVRFDDRSALHHESPLINVA